MNSIKLISVNAAGQDLAGNPTNVVCFSENGNTFSFWVTTLKSYFENLQDQDAYFLECARQEYFLSNLNN